MTEEVSNPLLARLLGAYQEMRDQRAGNKRAFEEHDNKIKANMAQVEVALMRMMKESGSENLKIKGIGQAYLTTKTFASGKDWDALWKYIEESGNLDLLQRRISKKAVLEYMEANDGDLPPGVNVTTERAVAVRTA